MLRLDDVHTYYGDVYVLQGVSLTVRQGTAVALLGRNGMGKTTTISSIIGFNPPCRGTIHFKNKNISGLPANKISQMGIGLVPQGRRIFPSLTVKENLTVAARGQADDGQLWNIKRVYDLFPRLYERCASRANMLSGGEQQMLAVGRALMTNPKLIMMDEPSEGLAPIVVKEIGKVIRELKQAGFSILLVEQHVPMALSVADDVYIINKGSIVHHGTPEELSNNRDILGKYLGVGA